MKNETHLHALFAFIVMLISLLSSCSEIDKGLMRVQLKPSDVLSSAQVLENARAKQNGVTITDALTAGLVLSQARDRNIVVDKNSSK